MSVPSSKTTVTTDSPNFDTERICSTLGSPLMAVSTGKVMKDSTSWGASPGLFVSTCTWTFVTSGTASMGSFRNESSPNTTTRSHPMMTMRRLFREKSMSLLTMETPP